MKRGKNERKMWKQVRDKLKQADGDVRRWIEWDRKSKRKRTINTREGGGREGDRQIEREGGGREERERERMEKREQ